MTKAKELQKKLMIMLATLGKRIEDSAFDTPQYEMDTKAGKLIVCLETPNFSCRGNKAIFSLYSHFINPSSARKEGIDCNPYTGKWNWHRFVNEVTIESFVENVRWDISRIIKKQE